MSEFKKCSRVGFCTHMESRLATPEANAKTKGLVVFELTNRDTRKKRVAGVVHKQSSKDAGWTLNFCPWCGADIDFLDEHIDEKFTNAEKPSQSQNKCATSSPHSTKE